jgi:hypothetical protein
MKRYIRANSSDGFSTKDEICDAVTRVFSEYNLKKDYLSGSKQYVFSFPRDYGHGLSICVGRRDTSGWVPGGLYSSSAADKYPCVLEILDSKDNAQLLDAFYDFGLDEVRNYQNSQWGTYKIIIRDYADLQKAKQVLEQYLQKQLPYSGY